MKRLSFLIVTVVACGGATQEEVINPAPVGPSPARSAKRTTSGDVSFELPAIEIKGAVFEPGAIDHPGVPLVDAKRKTTIDKQRSLVRSTRDPVLKQAQAAILATMLYRESKTDQAKEKASLKEALQTLRDVAQAVGDKNIDEVTLRLLGTYELLLEDSPAAEKYPAAEKAWQALIEKDPKATDLPYSRAWLAYSQLKQFKNAEALAVVGPDQPDDKQPELAYAMAWAKLRTGDTAGAWQAIAAAARGWGQNTSREKLESEVLWFAGQIDVPLDQAAALVTEVLAKAKSQQYDLLARLGLLGYAAAGRWAKGIAALDKAVEVAGDAVPLNDRPVIRYSQADYAVRTDAPEMAAKFAKQTVEALAACGARCDKDKADTIKRVYLVGQLLHVLYATANDRRYYQPAHDLYELTIPLLDPATRSDAQQNLKKLETTLKNIKAGTGTHDKGAIGALLARHSQEVQTCYEAALGANAKLGGTITVNLESDASGVIKGVATEPKPGATGLAAVTKCVDALARQWKLPQRGMPGSTRIKLSYNLEVKK